MALTVDEVKAAFQNAIPRRRDDFEQRIKDRKKTVFNEHNYQQVLVNAVLQFAKEETRERMEMAAEKMRALLDSGWRPDNPTAIAAAIQSFYSGFDHWRKDPSSDLYAAVEASFADVAHTDRDMAAEYVRELGRTNVEAYNEASSGLLVYAGRKGIDVNNTIARVEFTGAARIGYPLGGRYAYHAFICHASEDKDEFVRPLAVALDGRGLKIWFDEFEMIVGDSLMAKIGEGLKSSRFGIVVFSKAFFRKQWTQAEMATLFSRYMQSGEPTILPVWHGVSRDEVYENAPLLTDRFALDSAAGLDTVVGGLLKAFQKTP